MRRLKNVYYIVYQFLWDCRYFLRVRKYNPGMSRLNCIYRAYYGTRHDRLYDSDGNVFWLPF